MRDTEDKTEKLGEGLKVANIHLIEDVQKNGWVVEIVNEIWEVYV